MVYYYESRTTTSSATNKPYLIYMGKDQLENDELIRCGWPEDVWFHVDQLSSAHVYLRLRNGMTMDDIPDELIQECASLVKAHSIAGCKVSFFGNGRRSDLCCWKGRR